MSFNLKFEDQMALCRVLLENIILEDEDDDEEEDKETLNEVKNTIKFKI